jgi:putative oxidoreductase
MKPVRTVARTLLSGIFVISGARALADPDPMVSRAKPVTDRVAPALKTINPRLPTDTRALIRANGAVQLTAGLLLAAGRLPRLAAVALAGTLVPTTVAGHSFWAVQDPAERAGHQIHFMKNLGLLGGLLLAAVDTGGQPGLRWRTGRVVHDSRRSVRRAVRTARRKTRIAVRSASAARRLPG